MISDWFSKARLPFLPARLAANFPGSDGHESQGHQAHGLDIAVRVPGSQQDRNVAEPRVLYRSRLVGVDLDLDARVPFVEIVQSRRKEFACEKRWHHHVQLTPRGRCARGPRDRGVERIERRLQVFEQLAASRRQFHRARAALEQRHAQVHLQFLHLMADGRRRQGEPVGRILETRVACREAKGPQQTQWRRLDLVHHGGSLSRNVPGSLRCQTVSASQALEKYTYCRTNAGLTSCSRGAIISFAPRHRYGREFPLLRRTISAELPPKSTMSPSDRPSSALANGETYEIRPSAGAASSSPTMR